MELRVLAAIVEDECMLEVFRSGWLTGAWQTCRERMARWALRGLVRQNEDHPNTTRPKEPRMSQREHTAELALLEEEITILFCEVDDAYTHLNPKGRLYASLKRLSDSEVIPSPSLSSYEVWRPNAPSCTRSLAFSPMSFRGWWTFIRFRSIAAFASSVATSSLCGEPSCPSWWKI